MAGKPWVVYRSDRAYQGLAVVQETTGALPVPVRLQVCATAAKEKDKAMIWKLICHMIMGLAIAITISVIAWPHSNLIIFLADWITKP
jgi:hypothetical protein